MKPTSLAGFSAAALALAALAGCADTQADTAAEAAPVAAAEPTVVTVTASDFAFDAPDTVTAGAVTFRLANQGPDLHHVYVVRLDEGKTVDSLLAALEKNPAHPPAFAHDMGGPNTPAPGGESLATVELTPGEYVMLCVIPGPDGVPHLAKGMMKPFTVVPAAGAAAAMPEADLTLTLVDYGFEFSEPLTAGRKRILLRNGAEQSHEVLFVRLAPGKTLQDVLAWLEKGGEVPGEPVGGNAAMAADVTNLIEADFEAGEYALLCFIPDHKTGKPHLMHGMASQITVAAS